MFNLQQIVSIALGLAAIALGALVPATAAVAIPVGAGLLGVAVPHDLLVKKDDSKS